jgi:hypothetical protein
MAKKVEKVFYVVTYRNPKDSRILSLNVKTIKDSSLGLSFIAVSDFFFEENSILVNPEEESKKLEFENIKTLHLSIYSILSIAEVGESISSLKFKNDKSNLLILSADTQESTRN